MFTVVLRADDPRVLRRMLKAAADLRVPYYLAERPPAADTATGETVHLLGQAVAATLPQLPTPAVIVTEPGGDPPNIGKRGLPVAEVALSEVTPAALLKALVSVTVRAKSSLVARELALLGMFRELPMDLIAAFLENPSRMVRSSDLRRMLPLSRRGARALVRSSQRTRGEHLFTALRSATCILLMSDGLNRAAIEGYLGITDRPTFRRACHRAGVPPPRHDADLSAFSA